MDILRLTLNMREAFLQYASLHAFFYRQHFYKQRQAEIGNAKQHSELELFTSKNVICYASK